MKYADITACLVTRGDVDMQPILDTLPYPNVILWDNSKREDRKTAGRYYAAAEAETPLVYFQDDDCIFRQHSALMQAYEPDIPTAVYGHGETPDGYDDLPLVCGGALVPTDLIWPTLKRYLARFPADDGFLYEADFVIGVLYPIFKHVRLDFEIVMEIAQHPSRLCNQPFQRQLKRDITDQARIVRDVKEWA